MGYRQVFPESNPSIFRKLLLLKTGKIEVKFRRADVFLDVPISDIVEPIAYEEVELACLHLPYIGVRSVREFQKIVRKGLDIIRELECNVLVAHPWKGKLTAEDMLELMKFSRELVEDNAVLCWETLPDRERFLKSLDDYWMLCEESSGAYSVCLDIAHLNLDTDDVVEMIQDHVSHIKVIHMSNRISDRALMHIPIFDPRGHFDYGVILRGLREAHFDGIVILHYARGFRRHYYEDLIRLEEFLLFSVI
ncbi:MAG: hypothetical protein DRM97_01715 [Thermoprotei archaeon]|nr:MAG: hypothetical protein DRM97_01715 [Thermoprotei archaeon]